MSWTNWLARNPPPTQEEVEGPVLDAWISDMPRALKQDMLGFLKFCYPKANRAWQSYLEGRISPLKMAKVLSQTYWNDLRMARAHAQRMARHGPAVAQRYAARARARRMAKP
jgi:hypothetical protein